jgi:hypothetical protein
MQRGHAAYVAWRTGATAVGGRAHDLLYEAGRPGTDLAGTDLMMIENLR